MNSRKSKWKNFFSGENFSSFLIYSIILHALIFFFIFFNFNLIKQKKYEREDFLDVSLVPQIPQDAGRKNVAKEKEKTEKSTQYNQIKKVANLKTKKKKLKVKAPKVRAKKKKLYVRRKKRLKKNKKPERDIKNIISEYKKELSKPDTDANKNIAKEIEAYKSEIEKSDKSKSVYSDLAEGAEIEEKINKYRFQVAYEVEKNWALPAGISSSEGETVEASIIFKVMPDGRIKDIWFDKKSGNRYFDDSVLRAVEKSDPVLPYPEDIKEEYITIGLHFTPEGLD